ncbi:MAG: peptide chain release factor N(5)-glutamine methyltransferase [Verrucomicrobiales bacterium]|jgi:release factor glutamine methyltransferase|nr:peptide chain release factor N(5)-glutamine methyltransferase [Verrucomicrobiales bacterium]
MNLLELIDKTAAFFKQKNLESPRLQIELILAHVLKLPRMGLYLQFERTLTVAELDALRPLVRRRADGEPLQHILGETEFHGLAFACGPAALIPRPETEVLVAWVLELLRDRPAGLLYDIGTGSGVIALTVAKQLPAWRVIGVDLSGDALALARQNQERLGAPNVTWLEHDLLPAADTGHVIVANLPYLTDAEMAALPREVTFDPALALRGGADGLALIRPLIAMTSEHTADIFLETGAAHAPAVADLLRQVGFANIETRGDLAGVPRFTRGTRR